MTLSLDGHRQQSRKLGVKLQITFLVGNLARLSGDIGACRRVPVDQGAAGDSGLRQVRQTCGAPCTSEKAKCVAKETTFKV